MAGFFALSYSPSTFAPIAILTVFTPVVTLVASLGLDQAYFRQLVISKAVRASRRDIVVLSIVPIAILPLMLAVSSVIANMLGMSQLLLLLSTLCGTLVAGSVLPLSAYLRAQRRTVSYLALFASVAAVSVCVRGAAQYLGLPAGFAWLLGDFAVGVLGVVLAIFWHRRSSSTAAKSSFGELVSYGVPITIHGVFQWVLGSADRIIYAVILSPAAVGTYGAVYQFSGIFGAAASEVNKSGLHRYPGCQSAELRRLMRRDRAIFIAIWAAGLPAALLAFVVLQAHGYEDAIKLGTCLYASFLPLAFYLPLANTVSLLHGNSRWMSISSAGGAGVNVILNILLAPVFQLYAGAIANAFGYAVMMFALFLLLRRGSVRQ
ncbi:lipopolysaccharide biosynthesis protein [Rhodococcus sp. T2V]|uniref:lipopolysaccharide biosynthesis protein n=1 Tax=Rhodococcus sp. T2V TaxID=3034164 RepID=UPI0034E25FD2